MEETINDIVEYVKRKTSGFSFMDQAQMFSELESRLADLNADALRIEYLGSNNDEYIIDSVRS